MKTYRIPVALYKFVQYVQRNNDYLNTVQEGDTEKRGKVLGLTAEELATLAEMFRSLVSGDPATPGIWDLHSNKDTKNALTRQQMLSIISEFKKFYRPLLNRMSGSALIIEHDYLVLNIAMPVTSHSHPTVQIPEKCFTNVIMLGTGDVKFECRSSSDTKRASRPEGSNGVEISYRLDPPIAPEAEGSGNSAIKVVRTQLAHPNDGTTRAIFTKAIFTMKFGGEYSGYYLQFFIRWINTIYPELAGSWSSVIGTTIS
jgi:hypothetical protein